CARDVFGSGFDFW
nr:immunoglobulin heavy chain junction region [Macaca mulatta]MOV91344.1 immunoglobulin heavy chain junction region [Macaca mulatta]MOV91713.1 immunoglobulin heavy chain junction region [Macaca mulatta]MOV92156.1 immunoglobulin heavy chain junction region [Macaca mulatta]